MFPLPRSDEGGFTLVEVLVTMTLLLVGLAGTMSLIDGANARTVVTKEREGATALAREVLENARSVQESQLTTTGLPAALQGFPGLQDTVAGGAWTVDRRNQTYTITTSLCSVDDQQDGYGNHSGGNFCSTASGTADKAPYDYKRLTVVLSWTRNGNVRTLSQTGIVGHETGSAGPELEFVDQDPNPGIETETTASSSIRFTVQTTEVPAKIVFSVDGVTKATTTPSGNSSVFTWQIDGGPDGHVLDATYTITATAYDATNRPGPSRSVTVKLNRDLPMAVSPSPVRGGYNPRLGVVELEWDRNPEPDIMGYRVYRDRQRTQLVCQFLNQPTATGCIDNLGGSGAVEYHLYALDTAPVTLAPREGAAQPIFKSVQKGGTRQPVAPASLTATTSNGNVVLSWPASPTPTYDAPNLIRFYRIYRGGTTLGSRIAISTALSYTDPGAAGKGYRYYLTAVDKNFSESPIIGPIP